MKWIGRKTGFGAEVKPSSSFVGRTPRISLFNDNPRKATEKGLELASLSPWGRPGAGNAGTKVMTLISAMALGADCIDDCDIRTFLRSFTFGHVRQLDRVLGERSDGRGRPGRDRARTGS